MHTGSEDISDSEALGTALVDNWVLIELEKCSYGQPGPNIAVEKPPCARTYVA